MKVKLLWSHFLPDLDKKINEFIQGKKIIDIKFTEVVSDDYGKGDCLIILFMGLLVMTFLMFGAVACDLFKIIRNRKYGRKRKEEK